MTVKTLLRTLPMNVGIENAFNTLESTPPETLLLRAKTAVADFLPRLMGALLFLILCRFLISGLIKLTKRILKASKIDPTLHSFILGVIRYSCRILVFIIALLILRVPVSPLVAVLGSVGLALSLALKDSLSNLAGGISILLNRPFLKGDLIAVQGAVGTVRSIELFYTRMVMDDGKIVYLPNGDVSKSIVTNYSAEPLTRVELTFTVPEQARPAKVRDLIGEVLSDSVYLLAEPAPVSEVTGKSEEGLKIVCKAWVKAEYYETATALLKAEIEARLQEASGSV